MQKYDDEWKEFLKWFRKDYLYLIQNPQIYNTITYNKIADQEKFLNQG